MITFDEIKTLIGTDDLRTYSKLINKIHSVEVAKAIIFIIINQKWLSAFRGERLIKNDVYRKWIQDALFEIDDRELEIQLFEYDAIDVLDAWDEEKKNNDNEGN